MISFEELTKLSAIAQHYEWKKLEPTVQKEYFKLFEARVSPWMDDFYKETYQMTPDRSVSTFGFDLALRGSGKTRLIEEKYRTRDWKDCAIELIQDMSYPMTQYKQGWFYTSTADELLYIICDGVGAKQPGLIYSVNMRLLKGRLMPLLKAGVNHTFLYSGDIGKGQSVNVCIPWEELKVAEIVTELHKDTKFLYDRNAAWKKKIAEGR